MKTERRTLRPRDVDEQRRGSERIAPGIWRDAHGGIHWSVVELLALVGLPDTPANREAVVDIVKKSIVENADGRDITIVEQDVES